MQAPWVVAIEVAAALVALVAAVYGFTRFIDWRVEKRMTDSEYIARVAAALRPSLIFDQNGSILADQGGLAVIDKVTVELDANSLPNKITIIPTRHLATAPLLQTLEVEAVIFTTSRGPGLAWVYSLEYIMWHDDLDGLRRFRLEIL